MNKLGRSPRFFWHDSCNIGAKNRTGIIRKSNHTAFRIFLKFTLHKFKQSLFLSHTINNLNSSKKSMTRMFRVSIVKIHNLHNGRITTMFFNKIVIIEITIPFIHGNTWYVFESIRTTTNHIHLIHFFWLNASIKCSKRLFINHLRHTITMSCNKVFNIIIVNNITPRTLNTGYHLKPHIATNRNHIRRPRCFNIKSWTNFHNLKPRLKRRS